MRSMEQSSARHPRLEKPSSRQLFLAAIAAMATTIASENVASAQDRGRPGIQNPERATSDGVRPERRFDRRANGMRASFIMERLASGAMASVTPDTLRTIARNAIQHRGITLARDLVRLTNAQSFARDARVTGINSVPWQAPDREFDAREPGSTQVTSVEDAFNAYEQGLDARSPQRQIDLSFSTSEAFEADQVTAEQALALLGSGLFLDEATQFQEQSERMSGGNIDLSRTFSRDEILVFGRYVEYLNRSSFWSEQVSNQLSETQAQTLSATRVQNGRIPLFYAVRLFRFAIEHGGRMPRMDNLSWAPSLQRDNGPGAVTPTYVAASFGIDLARGIAVHAYDLEGASQSGRALNTNGPIPHRAYPNWNIQ